MATSDVGWKLDFAKMGGLVPAIVQDSVSGEVLMLGYMNEDAFDRTRATGRMHFFSRSKNRIWMKGETSGHTQEVSEILVDCDEDAIVCKVRQIGGATCHLGYRSDFFRSVDKLGRLALNGVPKLFDPDKVYGS
jgi:phosphoribosyl-AMP cyclohydrolase